MLKPIKTGWKKLDSILADVAEAVNRQKPLRAHGVFMDETPSGTFIATVPIDDQGNPAQSSSGSSSGDDDSALQIQISALQAQVSILIAEITALQTILQNGNWTTVTVVNPAQGCAQSQIQVFSKGVGQ